MFFFVLWGVLVWLGATTFVRLGGQWFFNGDFTMLLFAFGIMIPLIALATYPFYRWRDVKPSERPTAALYAVLPGMILDVFVILFFPFVFPNLEPTEAAPYSAWLFWGYSLGLMTGFIPNYLPKSVEQ